MLKSISLRIIKNVSRNVLTCNECKKKLEFYGMDYLKQIANEHGWKYDENEDEIYCFSCQEENKEV